MTDKSRSHALITGCCGFIGSHLASTLLEAGWLVDGVDDMSNGSVANVDHLRQDFQLRVVPTILIPAFERNHEHERTSDTFLIFEGDFCSPVILKRIVDRNYDVIFHLAAEPSVEISIKNPAQTAFNNLQKTIELMAASVGAIRRFVFASSAAVYGNLPSLPVNENSSTSPASPYALQKRQVEETGELFQELYDFEFVSLRMFNVYGPRQSGSSPYSTVIASWCDKVKRQEPVRLDGDGKQSRDLIYVKDACEAFLNVALFSGSFGYEVFNVATGIAQTNNYVLSLFHSYWSELQVKFAPPRVGDIRHSVAEVKKIKEVLKFNAKTRLSQGLELTFRSWDLLIDS